MGIGQVLCCIAVVAASVGAGCADVGDDAMRGDSAPSVGVLIAHRGASAYAPEHTLEAYELAMEQGADFIEPDLQITRDGVLIALHDETLERTTDVRDVFPDRFREEQLRGARVRRWRASDFTLAEIRRLDAGSWFDERFRGARVPTLSEVIEVAEGRAGIFPETKAPESYTGLGFEMERLLLEELRRHGLERPGADPRTPVFVQSFSAESLRILRHDLESALPSAFLVSGSEAQRWLTPEGLQQVRAFATGIAPAKRLLLDRPEAVEAAHQAGLSVFPWTFRSGDSGTFATVGEEMEHFLCVLEVDGLFTNNPDRFPRSPGCVTP